MTCRQNFIRLKSYSVLLSFSLLFACNSSTDPAKVPAKIWKQQGTKLMGTGAVGLANQGGSVSISADGNTAIVGGDQDNSGAGGAAWVYTWSNGVWSQQGSKLVGTGAVSGGAIQGFSVSISDDGNTAIIGGRNDSAEGAAWIWVRSGNVWSQQGNMLVVTSPIHVAPGTSVSISGDGNTAIIGVWGDGNISRVTAWVYTRSGGIWSQQGSNLADTNAAGELMQGVSVSLSADGNTAIVGAWANNSSAGTVLAYTRSGGVWSRQGSNLVDTDVVGARQGYSVSLSADGNTAIVGGDQDNSGAGAVWVWVRSGNVWSKQGSKLVGTGAVGAAYQGISVSLSGDGNTAIVGGHVDNSFAGAAWVWVRSGNGWSQQGIILVGNGAIGSVQGLSVSLSDNGNTVIVGGASDNSYTGAAWVWVYQ